MANGTLKLPLNRHQYYTITGGPYRDRPLSMVGLKMAAEIKAPCDIDIPTVDFDTPDRKLLLKGLHKAVDALLAGDPIYVGCMGGIGRTGLFLAILAKVFGVPEPVAYVRAHYLSHAVETPEQKAYVRKFKNTRALKRKIAESRRTSQRRFWKTQFWLMGDLTNAPSTVSFMQRVDFLAARFGIWITSPLTNIKESE